MEAVVTEGSEFRQGVGIEPFWLKFLTSLSSGEKDSGTVEKLREWEMENGNIQTKIVTIVPILNMLHGFI